MIAKDDLALKKKNETVDESQYLKYNQRKCWGYKNRPEYL